MKKYISKIALVSLLGYTLLLSYWMLLGFDREPHPYYMYNLTPFLTIKNFLQINNFNSRVWVINLIGNIAVFLPFGILIPLSFGGRYFKMLKIFLGGLLVLETLQLITRRGSFDVDDFILNSVGAMVGYGLYIAAEKWAKSRIVKCKKDCKKDET